MAYFLGLDIGTSATKALLIDERGAVCASGEADHPISRPRAGWSEQEPDWWWTAACRAIAAAITQAKVSPDQIAAVSFSGQMHGSVFLPRDADPADPKPVRPALLWNDQRTTKQCRQIEKKAGGRKALIRMVGNPALTGMTAPKILWLKESEPRNFEEAATVLLPKDYIRFRLTGQIAIDVSDASGTLLLNPRTRNWHTDLIRKIGLDKSILPPVVESIEQTGAVTARAARETGLKERTPVVAGAGDQMAGAVGMGIVEDGFVSATLGTSGVVFAHAGGSFPEGSSGAVQVMCAAVPGEYCVYGCMLSAAGALNWFRETFAPDEAFISLDDEAASVNPGSDGLVFLPYLTGERCPHPDAQARGAFVGLTARHTRGHLVRAVLEGVAFGMADILDLIRALGVNPREIRLGGGGAKSELWREIQANCYNTPVATLQTSEGSAYGAALLAGVGVGHWSSVAESCEACLQISSAIEPDPESAVRYETIRKTYDALYPALRDSFSELAGIEEQGESVHVEQHELQA